MPHTPNRPDRDPRPKTYLSLTRLDEFGRPRTIGGEEIEWTWADELAADRAMYKTTGNPDWLPAIKHDEEMLEAERLAQARGEPLPPGPLDPPFRPARQEGPKP